MIDRLTRRDFIKLTAFSTSSLAFKPPPPLSEYSPIGLGRVTIAWIGLYKEPTFLSPRLAKLERDTLITLLSASNSDNGPLHNPLWYRISDGYVHSGHLQIVRWELQKFQIKLPEEGALFEVNVPFTRSYRMPDPRSDPLYRLYYQSTAWVISVERGADGRMWYCLLDDLLNVQYYVRAEHLRMILPKELTPISPDIPPHEKHIEVHISNQELLAYERDHLVFRTRISSGVPSSRPTTNGIPTATPKGNFYITNKTPLRHMGDGYLTADLDAYELPGVPWVSFFTSTGVAFHGTYWHTDYGKPKSHGCINMRSEEAKWLFRWTTPEIKANEILKAGHGTSVQVI